MTRNGIKEWLFLGMAAGLWTCPVAGADPERKARPVQELVQEIKALETLYFLKATPEQIQVLKKLGPDTVAKATAVKEIKVDAKLRKVLEELHSALADAMDNDRIEQLSEQVEKLRESEKVQWEEEYEITEEAGQQAPAVLKTFSPRQVALYLAQMGDEILDPHECLKAAIDEVRGLAKDKWKKYREEKPQQIAHFAAGLDGDKDQQMCDQIIQFLIVIRSLKEEEFKSQRPDLEKKAQTILADIGPTEVLRNVMETNLAELLSNPRLPAVIDARLKRLGNR